MEERITRREKVEILIEFIKEHHRLPKNPRFNNGQSEYIYSDGMEIHNFYRSLQQCYKKAKKREAQGLNLREESIESIKSFERVQECLFEYIESKEKKVKELIECVKNENNSQNKEKRRKLFSFFSHLQKGYHNAMKKKNKGEALTDTDIENIEYYLKVKKVFAEYAPNKIKEKELPKISKEEKVKIIIKDIEKSHKLPKSGTSFKDETDKHHFYWNLQLAYKTLKEKEKNGEVLTKEELESIEYYEEVERTIAMYYPKLKKKRELSEQYKISLKEKVDIIIEFIEINHRLPKQGKNGEPCEYIYQDGADMYRLYSNLQQNYKRCIEKEKRGESLTKAERKKVLYFESIQETLSMDVVTKEEKVEKIIEFIIEKKRTPKSKVNNNGQSEYLYRDGTDMYGVYWTLQQTSKKAKEKEARGETLTETEKENIEYFEKIQEVLASGLERATAQETRIDFTQIAMNVIEEENLTREELENLRNALSEHQPKEPEQENKKQYIKHIQS